jgi:hypothetical protein
MNFRYSKDHAISYEELSNSRSSLADVLLLRLR